MIENLKPISKINGYNAIYSPNNHLAMSNGMVYEHKLVAEKILKRELYSNEVVHHKDLNRMNNSESNLIIFHSAADHASFHNQGLNEDLLEKLDDGSYIVKNIYNRLYCPLCGNKKEYSSVYCNNCRIILNRKVERPSANELKEILLKNKGNFTKVAKLYGLTDNAVRKWCKFYDMPYHSKDYRAIA